MHQGQLSDLKGVCFDIGKKAMKWVEGVPIAEVCRNHPARQKSHY